MMKKLMTHVTFFAVVFAFILSFHATATAQTYSTLRIATYNSLNYPANSGTRDPELKEVLQYIDPDILIIQEVVSSAGLTQFLANVMNDGQPGTYAAAPFSDGYDTDNGMIYKLSAVSFIGPQTVLDTDLRDINGYRLRPVGLSVDTLDIHIYSTHLKASEGYEADRHAEAAILRSHLNSLTPGHFVVGGDMNLYTSTEPAFQEFIESQADNSGRLYDPINSSGNWHDGAAFADVHTQSTREPDNGDGGASGGLDDRFDFLLPTLNFQGESGWQYVPDSYTNLGNDGNHLNQSINAGANTAVPTEIANALYYASDHLPVYLDVRRQVLGPASVTLVTPNGSEIWYTGFSRNITWTSENVPGTVSLEVNRSFPSATWETIVSSTTNDGVHSWLLNGPLSEFARVRISVDGQPAVKDSSDANFYVQTPVLTIVNPNGGETWYNGTTRNIDWSSLGIDGNVKIELNRAYPSPTWETLFPSLANDGTEGWPVSGTVSTHARFRITSLVNSSISDTCDSDFNISNPFLTLQSPNGGEIWYVDESETIQWNSGGLSGNVAISLNRSYPSVNWETIIASTAVTALSADWTVTDPITEQARIRIIYTPNSQYSDTSAANFEIAYIPGPPVILHDARGDTVPGPVTFTAIVTDDLPGFVTKLHYRTADELDFDSLTMTATGNTDEFAASPTLSFGAYDYFIRSTDALAQNSSTELSRLMIVESCEPEISYDNGTAELFNWSADSGFSWAVKFTPPATPFVLCEARVAIAAFSPDLAHSPIDIAVIQANGSGGMPGDTLLSLRRGSIGNLIGGFPSPGAYWAIVNLQDAGVEAPVLTSDFYIAVANGYDAVSNPHTSGEAFGLDDDSYSGRSVVYEPCDEEWIIEDGEHDNSRFGNRMIRARGWISEPSSLVVQRSGEDIRLSWSATGAPYYLIYRSLISTGPFDAPIGAVSDTTWLDTDAVTTSYGYFYRVESSASSIPE
jgi:endonuclease/exonuclease/phosphatase family metal-dependent hydrolase